MRAWDVCSKVRIFGLELLPREGPKLDTWGFEVNFKTHVCVQGRLGLQRPGSKCARGRAAELHTSQLFPGLSAVDAEMASQRFPR